MTKIITHIDTCWSMDKIKVCSVRMLNTDNKEDLSKDGEPEYEHGLLSLLKGQNEQTLRNMIINDERCDPRHQVCEVNLKAKKQKI